MRLIDADRLYNTIIDEIDPISINMDGNEMRGMMRTIIAAEPTIDTVPLGPLCEWLAGVASGNQSICRECAGSDDTPCPDEDELCKCPQAWKRHIRAWMQKEGLDAAN